MSSLVSNSSTSKTPAAIGLAFAIFFWGTQLPIAHHVIQTLDQYYFLLIRYGIGVWLFILTLYWREGRQAFSLDGKGPLLIGLGVCGFTCFGLLIFCSLQYTTPAHVAIILASQPMLTALWMWFAQKRRPSTMTLVCIVASFAGLLMIITRGDLAAVLRGGSLFGDALALAGAICWAVYTLGQLRFPAWSPFRYATLANIAGTLGVAAVVLPLTLAGVAHVPQWSAVASNAPALVYIAVLPLYASIILFGIAVARLGALNTLLAGNGTPVVVFAIEAVSGRLPLAVEWLGAAIVIAALAVNNLSSRRAG